MRGGGGGGKEEEEREKTNLGLTLNAERSIVRLYQNVSGVFGGCQRHVQTLNYCSFPEYKMSLKIL